MFTGKFKITVSISIIIIVVGIILAVVSGGLNLGIDFTGGSITTIDIKTEFETEVIQDALEAHNVADSQIMKSGDGYTEVVIRMKVVNEEELQADTTESILAAIQETYPDAELVSVDSVGGTTSSDLVRDAFLAVIVACGLMLVYIWIRFELFSGVAAVIALTHDVLIMIAVVAITQMQINSGFIAACLTIVGYSINNTIVIFDRIRDNKKVKPKSFTRNELADVSIKETITRTINTTVTTLIMIVCLYVFGVESIKEFSLPIIVGLVAGTYSSVFLSAPIWAKLSDAASRRKTNPTQKKKNNGKKSKKK
ncbi:protein translocase subunit SecF [Christensenellaceae bacterium OttesenSCG-928-K19]|nr:protein translocase subunit SecF [Christensenellaceae bacterium OttesenSCG-928-K19]